MEQEGRHVVIGLAGNKLDLNATRQVEKDDVIEFCNENNYIFFETSAKVNININEIFDAIAQEIPNRKMPKKTTDIVKGSFIEEEEHKSKCGCILL